MRIQPVINSKIQDKYKTSKNISFKSFKPVIVDEGYFIKYLDTLDGDESLIKDFTDALSKKLILRDPHSVISHIFKEYTDEYYEKLWREQAYVLREIYKNALQRRKEEEDDKKYTEYCSKNGFTLIPFPFESIEMKPFTKKIYDPGYKESIEANRKRKLVETQNPEPNPKDHINKQVIDARKNLTKQGQKSYLDNEDFYWQYDPETKIASCWMVNRYIFEAHAADDEEMDFFNKCIAHLDDKTIEEQIFKKRNFFFREETVKQQQEEDFNKNIEAIRAYRKTRKMLPVERNYLQRKFVLGSAEFLQHQQEIQLRFFDVLKQAQIDSSIKTPNGILITGNAGYGISKLTKWIKSHNEINYQKVAYNKNNPENSIKQINSAFEQAELNYFVTGKRTLIDISDFANLLTNNQEKNMRKLISKFKIVIENASKKYATVLIAAPKQNKDFEPSSISGKNFDIKINIVNNPLDKNEKNRLQNLEKELEKLSDDRYYLQEYCIRRSMYCPIEQKTQEDYEKLYTYLNGKYSISYDYVPPDPSWEKHQPDEMEILIDDTLTYS